MHIQPGPSNIWTNMCQIIVLFGDTKLWEKNTPLDQNCKVTSNFQIKKLQCTHLILYKDNNILNFIFFIFFFKKKDKYLCKFEEKNKLTGDRNNPWPLPCVT